MTKDGTRKRLGIVSIEEMISYEDGEMEHEDVVNMFQRLIDSGLAWQLQGSYGRMAARLIEEGACNR